MSAFTLPLTWLRVPYRWLKLSLLLKVLETKFVVRMSPWSTPFEISLTAHSLLKCFLITEWALLSLLRALMTILILSRPNSLAPFQFPDTRIFILDRQTWIWGMYKSLPLHLHSFCTINRALIKFFILLNLHNDFFFFFFLIWYWELRSGLCACQKILMPLSCCPSSIPSFWMIIC